MATAAHCVCMHESFLVKCEGGKIKYDAGEVIRVFVGLNTQDITVATERHRRLYEKQVEEVWSEYIVNGIKFIVTIMRDTITNRLLFIQDGVAAALTFQTLAF